MFINDYLLYLIYGAIVVNNTVKELKNLEILKAIQHRNSRPFLEEPAPSEQEMREVYKAALRAPDHAWLRPWRYLEVRGEAGKNLLMLLLKLQKLLMKYLLRRCWKNLKNHPTGRQW